ncbi:MAG: sugar transferase [Simkaniaceae bacterium]|nr:sugar transferase [Simkaniaceae bacterium]
MHIERFFYFIAKRLFDIFFSLIVIIVGSPLFFLIAIGIKLTSPGPILYKSMRVKKDFEVFRCLKFRTMYTDADEKLALILEHSPEKRAEWENFYKLKDDPRITFIGAFLRKTSLDEIPQFLNVLKGDMSIVGPRPMAVSLPNMSVIEEIKRYLGNDAYKILSIKPGITGLWQTSGRNHLTLSQRAKLDMEYIEKRSFLLDLWLIIKTIPLMIHPKGAY